MAARKQMRNGDNREETRWLVRCVSLPVLECPSLPKAEFFRVLEDAWRLSTDLANWASHTLARHDVVRTPDMKHLPPMPKVDLYGLAFGRPPGRFGKTMVACRACGRRFFPSQCAAAGADFVLPPHQKGRGDCPGAGAAAPAARNEMPAASAQIAAAPWAGAKINAQSILGLVQAKYKKERGKAVWLRERRTPEFTYPVPFPVHNQSWEFGFDGHGKPLIFASLPGGKVTLRLSPGEKVRTGKNGKTTRPALEVLKKIEAGELARMELKICAVPAEATHRMGVAWRLPGGRSKDSYRVVVRVSYRLEAPAYRDGPAATLVTGAGTDAAPFLALTVAGSHVWHHHGLQARLWIGAHRAFLRKFSDEEKFERRRTSNRRRKYGRHRERLCDRQNDRMDSFVKQLAHQAVAHAARNECGVLMYDDRDRSFAESFPWFQLSAKLEEKCREFGLRFVAASATAAKTKMDQKPAEAAPAD